MYDPQTNTWVTKSPVPIVYEKAITVVYEDKIYVYGSNFQNNNGMFQIYDPQTDTWTTGPALPLAAYAGIATTGIYAPKKIYLFGEETMVIFDPQSQIWSNGASVPNPSYGVAVVNDVFYLMSSTVLRYIPFGYSATFVSVSSPANNANYTSSNIPLEFTLNKQVTTFTYSLNRGNNITVTGNTTLSDLTNGEHILTLYATDKTGNIDTQTISFKVTLQENRHILQDPTPIATITAITIIGTIITTITLLSIKKNLKAKIKPQN